MDAGATGAILGLGVMACLGMTTCLYEKYRTWKKKQIQSPFTHQSVPLLRHPRSEMRRFFSQEKMPPLPLPATLSPIQVLVKL